MSWFLSKFVKRQTKASRFSHWDMLDVALLTLVVENWEKRKPGYKDGVVLVPVPPDGFFTSTVFLKKGDKLRGGFEPRVEGEEPRKFTCLDTGEPDEECLGTGPNGPAVVMISRGGKPNRGKQPAVAVDIVLYRKDVLDEDNDWKVLESPWMPCVPVMGEDWAIVSVNAHPTADTNVPIEPDTLIANHFHLSGGTNTGMTNDEFVDALRISVLYWKDKTVLG